ncbi:hypothetical protein Bca52824_032917 [Brassica carinata]|uniref:GGDEF domain-containing protein n=1 Tax=Brassica carinata TaxID=52824 RepID=A0A8X7V920_BRACI|nr:hypothetical protein Bca52824_032917 [Brassica carinata]
MAFQCATCDQFEARNPTNAYFVVQHVLKLNDLLCTFNVAVNIDDHCVELSSKKYGSYIVEKLLETEESMAVVVAELLECKGDRLMRLARSEYGKFVVAKALLSRVGGDDYALSVLGSAA